MKISVIMPVYNAEKYVCNAVASALQQPETGEILLVEDNSSDNCLQICQDFEKEHEKVKLLRHPDGKNHGAGATRNLGIKNTKFDYIAFLDADDYYLPDRFTVAKELFEKYYDVDGVYEAKGCIIGVPTLAGTRRRWLSFTRGVVRILDTHPFSIVHVHSSCKYFLLFKLFSSSKAKFVHHITTSPIRPLRFHRFRSMLLTYLQSLFMDAVLVHSEELKDNYLGIKHLKRAHVIPVGFNKKVLYPISNNRRRRMRFTLGIPENHQVLVYCAGQSTSSDVFTVS